MTVDVGRLVAVAVVVTGLVDVGTGVVVWATVGEGAGVEVFVGVGEGVFVGVRVAVLVSVSVSSNTIRPLALVAAAWLDTALACAGVV